jgi:hypothetical protein
MTHVSYNCKSVLFLIIKPGVHKHQTPRRQGDRSSYCGVQYVYFTGCVRFVVGFYIFGKYAHDCIKQVINQVSLCIAFLQDTAAVLKLVIVLSQNT